MTLAIKGLGVSKGIAMGPAQIVQRGHVEIGMHLIASSEINTEKARFKRAVKSARRQLKAIRKQIPAQTPENIAEFIDSHLLMLEDAALSDIPAQIIKDRKCNAEWALKLQRDALVSIFDEMEDEYLRTRKDDVDHVVQRIQDNLAASGDAQDQLTANKHTKQIIIAEDLTPADTILMQHQGIAGFVTERGGPMSHTAILARSLQIPALVGASDLISMINNGEPIILDGESGLLYASADTLATRFFKSKLRTQKVERKNLEQLASTKAVTLDHQQIKLQANIEMPSDLKSWSKTGAEGVGLYRTEFLFLNRMDLPSENEQFNAYRKVLRKLHGAPLTIRTLDLGADKQNQQATGYDITPTNPALGLRAIRLCLKEPELFRTQLRAILRASVFGPVQLLIPMISSINELKQTKKKIADTKKELREQGIAFDTNIPLGAIIEVPAAAIAADLFAKHVDFLSIGTNDLIQYSLAIDRIDDEVNYLYDPLHPAVLRLIQMSIKAANKASIPIAMCGEMAGDTKYTRLLIGMGLTDFSMHPTAIPEVKQLINESSVKQSSSLAKRILNSSAGSEQTSALLQKLNLNSHTSF